MLGTKFANFVLGPDLEIVFDLHMNHIGKCTQLFRKAAI
jgi:hypothetical protein